jgi:hypothetical protein
MDSGTILRLVGVLNICIAIIGGRISRKTVAQSWASTGVRAIGSPA